MARHSCLNACKLAHLWGDTSSTALSTGMGHAGPGHAEALTSMHAVGNHAASGTHHEASFACASSDDWN